MKAEGLKNRALAYLIDMLLFIIVILICTTFLKSNQNVAVLNLELDTINELALNHEISINTYLNRYADIMHNLDQEKVMINLINCIFIMGYFVMLPYFFEGRTLGKKILGLKVKRRDGELLMLSDLIIRNLIINGLGFMLISLCILYIAPSMIYFIIATLLGILQILLVIVSVFMVIYRKDNRGLHDVLSETMVVREK
jgi:uncharacterized RDD family membrane protein YckC